MKRVIATGLAAAALFLSAAAPAFAWGPASTVPTFTTSDGTAVPSVTLPAGIHYYDTAPPLGGGYVRVFASKPIGYVVWVKLSVARQNGWVQPSSGGNGALPVVAIALGAGLLSLGFITVRRRRGSAA